MFVGETYVVADKKGLAQDEPRDRGLKKGHGAFESDKPLIVTLVRRSDEWVRLLVCDGLEDVNEDIIKYGNKDDPTIPCTDQYSIYEGIDEYDEIDHF